jgi:1-acyl-sn-glycerol-3-phosphate acyltransferase
MLGAGGLVFSILVIPLLRILPGGHRKRQLRVRWLISSFFKLVVQALRLVSVLRIEAENLPANSELGGLLVLASHPSYIDVVVLVAFLGKATCVVKGSIWNSPFFGSTVRAAGYIPAVDPEEVLEAGAKALLEGETLLIFPEGTRTHALGPFQFQRGAAHLVLRTGAKILPLIISCDPPFLMKGQKWYQIPEITCHYCINIRPILSLDQIAGEGEGIPSTARQLTKALETYYNQEVHGYDHHPARDETIHRRNSRSGEYSS